MLAWALVSAVFCGTPEAIACGDDAFFRISYVEAAACYRGALESDAQNPELLWRLSRVHVCAGEVAEGNQRAEHFRAAEEYGRRAVASAERDPDAHVWLAAALGYRALEADADQQIRLTWELLDHLHAALRLEPGNDIALSILGSTYRALGNVGWLTRNVAQVLVGSIPPGGREEAERALREAIAIAPDVMRHHYELGVLYLDMGRLAEARRCLARAEQLPVRVAIDGPRLERIRELLGSLPNDGRAIEHRQ